MAGAQRPDPSADIATNSATLGPIAPTGASSSRAISSVTSAATNVATTASMSAASTGATGTTAVLRMWGALARSWPAVANALADGIPAMVSEGSSMTIANHAPVTSATPIVASGCQRLRSPSVNIAAGRAAAIRSGATHDAPEKTRARAMVAPPIRSARVTTT